MLLWYRNRKRDRYYSCFLARDRAADSRFLIMRLFLLSPMVLQWSAGWANLLLEGGGGSEEGCSKRKWWWWGRELKLRVTRGGAGEAGEKRELAAVSEEAEESKVVFGGSMVVKGRARKSWNITPSTLGRVLMVLCSFKVARLMSFHTSSMVNGKGKWEGGGGKGSGVPLHYHCFACLIFSNPLCTCVSGHISLSTRDTRVSQKP